MVKKLKMKMAAKNVQRKKRESAARVHNRNSRTTKRPNWFIRLCQKVWRGVRIAYDTVCAFLSWIWECICGINLIGLLNTTLLIAIIVLFSMLIMDVKKCGKQEVVVVSPPKDVIVHTLPKSDVTLPLGRDKSNGRLTKVIDIAPVTPSNDPTLRPHADNNIYGDIIIETRGEAATLKPNTQINGNLYLQHMRKYVLPCGIKINGNLFLRDLRILEFCGDFTVTGNIYVTPNSSFGPLPRNAHIGGQVIL